MICHMLFLEYGLHDTYLLQSICLNALNWPVAFANINHLLDFSSLHTDIVNHIMHDHHLCHYCNSRLFGLYLMLCIVIFVANLCISRSCNTYTSYHNYAMLSKLTLIKICFECQQLHAGAI